MSSLAHRTHWIFDMDGTLTIASHDFDKIRQQLGIPEGQPILEAIEKMPSGKASSMHRELHRLEMEIAETSRPQPGVRELLTSLKDNGCKLGILTRNAEDIAHTTLQAASLAEFFEPDEIIGRERCEPKPDPAGIHLHLTQWNSTKTTAVMVGDYFFDLQAGRNAGVTTVHFEPQGNFDWPELTDIKIQSFDELRQYL